MKSMKGITRIALLLTLALGIVVGWSEPVHATEEDLAASNEAGLHATLDGCYELIDGELIAVEEFEVDKVYFISATLENVADRVITYWNPDTDSIYNNELYDIWFQLKLPTAIGQDAPGQVILEATASRRNYDDRWNTSGDTLDVYAKDGQVLALEFAPGYCDAVVLRSISDHHYYMRSEEGYTLVHGIHDSEYPLAPGAERNILLAVRTHDSQEFSKKRQLEETSHLQVSFASTGRKLVKSPVTDAAPILGDIVNLRQKLDFDPVLPELGTPKRLTVQIEFPRWLGQQAGDQWWLQTQCIVYAEDGNVCFWTELCNHGVTYDIDSAATQSLFTKQTETVALKGIEAWYFDDGGKKNELEATNIEHLFNTASKSALSPKPDNNGLSAQFILDGDLASKLAGKTLYVSYDCSEFNLAR